jgi:hypothetical protein
VAGLPFLSGTTFKFSITSTALTAVALWNSSTQENLNYKQILIYNPTSQSDVFFGFGSSSVVALVPTSSGVLNGTPSPSGTIQTFSVITTQNYFSGICAGAGTATIYITVGDGE